MFFTLFTIIFNYFEMSIIIWGLGLLIYLYSVVFVNFIKMCINKGRIYSCSEDKYLNTHKNIDWEYLCQYPLECIFTLPLRLFMNAEYKVKILHDCVKVPYLVTKNDSNIINYTEFMFKRYPCAKIIHSIWFNLRFYLFYKYPYAHEMLYNLEKCDMYDIPDVCTLTQFTNIKLDIIIGRSHNYYRDNEYYYFIKK